MKKKAKKWFSCITAAALVMFTVNLPIDVAGLTRRRNAEADLFLSNRKPDPITTTPSIWKNSDSYTVGDMVKFT